MEPIDDVKAQVQMNTNTMIQIKNMLDMMSAETMQRDEKIFKAIEQMKGDIKNTVSAPTNLKQHPRQNMSRMIKELVLKFEGTTDGQSEA